MTFMSIVAVASGEETDVVMLAAAARLASIGGAHVRVLPAYPDPAADLIAYGAGLHDLPDAVSARVREGERARQQELEARASAAAAQAGIRVGAHPGAASIAVEARALIPSVAIAEAAVLADVVLFAGEAARRTLSTPFAQTLLEARAPILIVKDGQFSADRVAIAWDGSPEAGRAVRAAMPLLSSAEDVVIVQNTADSSAPSKTVTSDDLEAYLARHGVKHIRRMNVEGDNVAVSLLRAAEETQCSALVAGAYGRPRLYELALGGTTRSLVNARGRLHLFLAH